MEYFWHELCSFPVLLYVRGKPKLQYCFPTEWHRRTGATQVFLFTRSSALFINIQSTIDKQKYILYIQFCQKKWFRFTFLSTLCMPVQYYLLPRSSLKALVSPMFQSTFLEKTLCRIYPLLYSYFVSNLFSISDNFSLSPSSNVGHFSLQTVWNCFFALYLHCLLNNFKQSSWEIISSTSNTNGIPLDNSVSHTSNKTSLTQVWLPGL